MKILKLIIFFVLIISINNSCSRYELDEQTSANVHTFKTVIGGIGYDVALDVIELNDSYLVVGASGPICDIVDAYAVKIDKKNGSVITSNRFGDFSQGPEENFQDVFQGSSGQIHAVGFRVQRTPDCGYVNFNSNMFLVTMDENLNQIDSITIKSPDNQWDAGNSVFVHDDLIYVSGHYSGDLGLGSYDIDSRDVNFVTTNLSSPNKYGAIKDVIVDNQNRAVMTGQAGGSCLPNFSRPLNTYFAIREFSSTNFIVDTFYVYSGRDVSEGKSIVQLEDHSFRVAVLTYDIDCPNDKTRSNSQMALLKLDSDGMNPEFIPIPIGFNDELNEMIKVEDGLVIAGMINSDNTFKNDMALVKIDFDGNLIWQRTFNVYDDIAFSVIQTKDEGFMIVGRTKNEEEVNAILMYKTDKEGLIEE